MPSATYRRMSRRAFLRLGLASVGTAALAACKPETVVVKETVEKVVTQQVEKVVEKEVTSVVEKVVTATPAPKEPVTIVHATWGGPMELEVMHNTAKACHEELPHINVEILQFPTDYNIKVDAMMVAGEGLDTLQVNMVDYATRGVILNLQPYIDVDPNLDLDDIFPVALAQWRMRGDMYGLPYGSAAYVLYWNVDYFESEGLDDPNTLAQKGEWTYEKLREYAMALTKKIGDKDVWGYFIYAMGEEPYWYPWNSGTTPYNAEYTECYLNTPENIKVFQLWADMVHKDKCITPRSVLAEIGTWNSFFNGDTAMFCSGPWQRGRLVGMQWKYDVAPIPKGPSPHWFSGGPGADVWVGTKHPQECYEWLAWRTKDTAAKIWGAQGVDTPPRRSQMLSDMWHSDLNPPHFEAYIEANEKGILSQGFIPSKANEVLSNSFNRIIDQNEPAEAVWNETNEEISTLMAQYQKWQP